MVYNNIVYNNEKLRKMFNITQSQHFNTLHLVLSTKRVLCFERFQNGVSLRENKLSRVYSVVYQQIKNLY